MTKRQEIVPPARSPFRALKWKKSQLMWYYGDYRVKVEGDTTNGLMFVIDRVKGFAGMSLRYRRAGKVDTIAEAKAYVEGTTVLEQEP